MVEVMNICVVIPVYNCHQYLSDAVNSVLNQPYQGIQIVLVDDGSTDGSSELCERLSEEKQNITVLHQQNGGVSVARNNGMEYVLETLYRESDKGYIAFLDADDVWKSDFFSQEVVDSLHKGYNLIGFRTYNCNGSLTRRECDSKFTAGKYIGESVSFGLYDHQHFAGMFYSFELLRKYPIKFRKGLAFGEDRLFSRECLYLAESLLLLDRPLYLYRNNTTSAVHNRPYGICYFEPMFSQWLESDRFLNEFDGGSNKIANQGKGYVGWYIADMIEDHLCHFGKKQEITNWMRKNQEYIALTYSYGGEEAVERYEHILDNMTLFDVKCKLKGIMQFLYRKVKCFPPVAKIVESKRYPMINVK